MVIPLVDRQKKKMKKKKRDLPAKELFITGGPALD